MKFRIEIVCVNQDDSEQRASVMEMERQELTLDTFGMSLAEGKTILSGIQDFVTSQQTSEYIQKRRQCGSCDLRHASKQTGVSTVQTVFGSVSVPNPRWERCACQLEGPNTFRPMALRCSFKGEPVQNDSILKRSGHHSFRIRKLLNS